MRNGKQTSLLKITVELENVLFLSPTISFEFKRRTALSKSCRPSVSTADDSFITYQLTTYRRRVHGLDVSSKLLCGFKKQAFDTRLLGA